MQAAGGCDSPGECCGDERWCVKPGVDSGLYCWDAEEGRATRAGGGGDSVERLQVAGQSAQRGVIVSAHNVSAAEPARGGMATVAERRGEVVKGGVVINH